MSDLFGAGGQRLLDALTLGDAYRIRVASLRQLIEVVGREITMVEGQITPVLAGDLGLSLIHI